MVGICGKAWKTSESQITFFKIIQQSKENQEDHRRDGKIHF
jgi:hypothetical protein